MRTLVIGLVLAALPAAVAVPAHADAQPCTTRTLSKPFAQWNDINDYFLVPGGTFE